MADNLGRLIPVMDLNRSQEKKNISGRYDMLLEI